MLDFRYRSIGFSHIITLERLKYREGNDFNFHKALLQGHPFQHQYMMNFLGLPRCVLDSTLVVWRMALLSISFAYKHLSDAS